MRTVGRTAGGVLAVQVCAVAAVLAWGTVLDRPWHPDDGLQQLDLLYLDEAVDGVEPVDGRPTLVAVAGDGPCGRQTAQALDDYGSPGGLPATVGFLVLAPPGTAAVVPDGARVQADPGGATAERLALSAPGASCTPGYALVDPAGRLRYRTVDPQWSDHAAEQRVLLDALLTEDRPE